MRKYFFIFVFAGSFSLWFLLFTKLFSTESTKLNLPRNYAASGRRLFNRNISTSPILQRRNENKIFVRTTSKLTSNVNGILNSTYRNDHNTSIEEKHKVQVERKRHGIGFYGSCSKIVRDNAIHDIPNVTEHVNSYFKDAYKVDKLPVKSWITGDAVNSFCDNNIRSYNDKFVMLKDTVLDITKRKHADKRPKGGERLKDVLGQNEADEFFEYSKGFWKAQCEANQVPVGVMFPWIPYLETSPDIDYTTKESLDELDVENDFTIAVTREDYVNLHNFVRQMYNAFLLMMIFKKQPKEVAILFLDGHPAGMLDKPWYEIFGKVTRAGTLPRPTLYKNIIWGFAESESGLSDLEADHLPYIEEFRSFFLQAFRVRNSNVLECNRVAITIILRRDKVFHPRNKEGIVGRKIFNEHELIEDLIKTFPYACVQAILMDALPLANQLEIIASTDILIGMHGAGMAHTVFLPKHAAILEMFSKGFKEGRPWFICYEKIANWRNLIYASWENFDSDKEMPYDYTIVHREQIVSKVRGLMKALCSS